MRNRLPLTKEGRRGCWLHEKSCYGSWRFTRGDRGDWPPRNIAAPSSPKGRFFRVKLALDDGTSPTSHAVTRMDSRSRYFTPFSYRGPSSLPASTLSIFPPSRRSGMDWLPFCQNLRGWGDPLIFHLCLLEEFLFAQVLLHAWQLDVTQSVIVNFYFFLLKILPNFIDVSKRLRPSSRFSKLFEDFSKFR